MRRREATRFADLLDGRPGVAPENSATASMVAIVDALRGMDFDVGPTERSRARLRQRLVAMAAVRTSAPPQARAARTRQLPGLSGGLHRARAPGWQLAGRRAIGAVLALSLVVAGAGILTLIAQNSIPGDTLYALKRGTEQAQLALAANDREQGTELLGFATTRLAELDQLLDSPVAQLTLGSAAGIVTASGSVVGAAPDADLLIDTMETMDRQTIEGTHALTTAAVDEVSVATLQFVGEWGIGQFEELDGLTGRMPEAAQTRAEESKDLLQRVVMRLEALARVIECDCLDDEANTDDLGPLPCLTCSEPGEAGAGSPATAQAPNTGSGGLGEGRSPPTTDAPPAPTPVATATSSVPTQTAAVPTTVAGPETAVETAPAVEPTSTQEPVPSDPSATPPEVPPTPSPTPTTLPEDDGQPCVLLGVLGIEIPGIYVNGVCVGLEG